MSLIPHHTSDLVCALCEQKLTEAHPDLVEWFKALKARHSNVHVSWSYRDKASQTQAFTSGASKLQFPQSAHNKQPAMALDIFLIDETGKAVWDPVFCAKVNQESMALGYPLKWGGNWKALGDNDHFELSLESHPV